MGSIGGGATFRMAWLAAIRAMVAVNFASEVVLRLLTVAMRMAGTPSA
jgi:hypothetical protein